MLGRFLNLNKMKTKIISNHMSQYFIHNRTDDKCLNGVILQLYTQNELISSLMAATGLKIVVCVYIIYTLLVNQHIRKEDCSNENSAQ